MFFTNDYIHRIKNIAYFINRKACTNIQFHLSLSNVCSLYALLSLYATIRQYRPTRRPIMRPTWIVFCFLTASDKTIWTGCENHYFEFYFNESRRRVEDILQLDLGLQPGGALGLKIGLFHIWLIISVIHFADLFTFHSATLCSWCSHD